MSKAIAGLMVAAAVIVAWLYIAQGRSGELVVSGFIEADEIRVGSRVGGRVARVLVEEGAPVKIGAALLEIDPFDLKQQLAEAQAGLAAEEAERDRLAAGFRPEEIAQARAQRDAAKAALEKLAAGPRKQEIEAARAAYEKAKADLEFARFEDARVARLRDQTGDAAAKESAEVKRSLKARESEAAAAEQQLAMLIEGSRAEDVAAARAALAAAEQALALMEAGYRVEEKARAAARAQAARSRVEAIQTQLAELTVSSPCDCTVEAVELRPGDLVAPNAPTIALLDASRLWVRAYVPEEHLADAAVGRRVGVRVDGFAGQEFAGRITFVAREAEFTPRNVQTPEERSKQVFRIKVTLEEGLDRLRVGMMADVMLGKAAGQ